MDPRQDHHGYYDNIFIRREKWSNVIEAVEQVPYTGKQ